MFVGVRKPFVRGLAGRQARPRTLPTQRASAPVIRRLRAELSVVASRGQTRRGPFLEEVSKLPAAEIERPSVARVVERVEVPRTAFAR